MTAITLIGAPVDQGQRCPGCLMGPAAYRVAGIAQALTGLGHSVHDIGDLSLPDPLPAVRPSTNPAVHGLDAVSAWARAIAQAVGDVLQAGRMPVIMGGDHALSLGSVAAAAAHAQARGRPLFVLWLDAHSDLHTPLSTTSGNLHGTPLGHALGLGGFDGFAPFPAPVPGRRICLFGVRSIDPAEAQVLAAQDIAVNDMRVLDEQGISAPLRRFLDQVAAEGGDLHVSLDVDFLDPGIAPAVGTTVPGGTSFREAHLVMEMVHDAGCMTSIDLVELNPALDMRNATARLMVDLLASGLGRKVFDRPTRPV